MYNSNYTAKAKCLSREKSERYQQKWCEISIQDILLYGKDGKSRNTMVNLLHPS